MRKIKETIEAVDDFAERIAGIAQATQGEIEGAAARLHELMRDPRPPGTPPPASSAEAAEAQAAAPPGGGPVRFPAGEGAARVRLMQAAEDLRRMHTAIALTRGGKTRMFEVDGWRPDRPVARLLAAGGFRSAPALGLAARQVEPEEPYVELMSFDVPEGAAAAVEGRIMDALAGRSGGFSQVVAGLTGFHRIPAAFALAWHAAGCPPVRVRHPEWVEAAPEAGRPGPIRHALEANTTHSSSSLYWGDITFDD